MKRAAIAIGMALGALWAAAIVLLPLRMGLPFVPPALAIPAAFLIPGLVMAMMIAAIARRRFFNDDLIDGAAAISGSGADIDDRVLRNTVEQMVLALLIWPFIGFSLGGVSILALGIGMAVARLLFWIGYHISPSLRALGFAASFYPTLFGAFWAVWIWVN